VNIEENVPIEIARRSCDGACSIDLRLARRELHAPDAGVLFVPRILDRDRRLSVDRWIAASFQCAAHVEDPQHPSVAVVRGDRLGADQ
jgi:hypothetical protein